MLLPSALSVQHLAAVDAGVSGLLAMSALAARTILPCVRTHVCVYVSVHKVCVCVRPRVFDRKAVQQLSQASYLLNPQPPTLNYQADFRSQVSPKP
jgi:hypothetical protein